MGTIQLMCRSWPPRVIQCKRELNLRCSRRLISDRRRTGEPDCNVGDIDFIGVKISRSPFEQVFMLRVFGIGECFEILEIAVGPPTSSGGIGLSRRGVTDKENLTCGFDPFYADDMIPIVAKIIGVV